MVKLTTSGEPLTITITVASDVCRIRIHAKFKLVIQVFIK